MYVQKKNPKENKSRAVANSVAQKKSNGKQGFGFVDNLTEVQSQIKKGGNRQQPMIPTETLSNEGKADTKDYNDTGKKNSESIQRYSYIGSDNKYDLPSVEEMDIDEVKRWLNNDNVILEVEEIKTLKERMKSLGESPVETPESERTYYDWQDNQTYPLPDPADMSEPKVNEWLSYEKAEHIKLSDKSYTELQKRLNEFSGLTYYDWRDKQTYPLQEDPADMSEPRVNEWLSYEKAEHIKLSDKSYTELQKRLNEFSGLTYYDWRDKQTYPLQEDPADMSEPRVNEWLSYEKAEHIKLSDKSYTELQKRLNEFSGLTYYDWRDKQTYPLQEDPADMNEPRVNEWLSYEKAEHIKLSDKSYTELQKRLEKFNEVLEESSAEEPHRSITRNITPEHDRDAKEQPQDTTDAPSVPVVEGISSEDSLYSKVQYLFHGTSLSNAEKILRLDPNLPSEPITLLSAAKAVETLQGGQAAVREKHSRNDLRKGGGYFVYLRVIFNDSQNVFGNFSKGGGTDKIYIIIDKNIMKETNKWWISGIDNSGWVPKAYHQKKEESSEQKSNWNESDFDFDSETVKEEKAKMVKGMTGSLSSTAEMGVWDQIAEKYIKGVIVSMKNPSAEKIAGLCKTKKIACHIIKANDKLSDVKI